MMKSVSSSRPRRWRAPNRAPGRAETRFPDGIRSAPASRAWAGRIWLGKRVRFPTDGRFATQRLASGSSQGAQFGPEAERPGPAIHAFEGRVPDEVAGLGLQPVLREPGLQHGPHLGRLLMIRETTSGAAPASSGRGPTNASRNVRKIPETARGADLPISADFITWPGLLGNSRWSIPAKASSTNSPQSSAATRRRDVMTEAEQPTTHTRQQTSHQTNLADPAARAIRNRTPFRRAEQVACPAADGLALWDREFARQLRRFPHGPEHRPPPATSMASTTGATGSSTSTPTARRPCGSPATPARSMSRPA